MSAHRQVLAVCRLLEIDSTTVLASNMDVVKQHLVEIRTGEGKSVTLAATSAVLALVGCDVNCACYSQYLSNRDYESFLPLFTAFKVTAYIKYGTFAGLCEDYINKDVDVRRGVETMVEGGDMRQVQEDDSGRASLG